MEGIDVTGNPKEFLRLSSGVVIRVQAVPGRAITMAMGKLRRPKPPLVTVGDHEEENPTDPEFLQAVEDYNTGQHATVLKVCILFGTELVQVPMGMDRPEDDGWLHKLEKLGLGLPEGADADDRYVHWMMYYALRGQTDEAALMGRITELGMVRQEDVAVMMAGFPGDPGGQVPVGAQAQQPGKHRDRVRGVPGGRRK